MNNILEKMDSDKEVLSTLPKNNKKNYSKYMEEVEKLKKEYSEYQSEIYNELKKRYQKIISTKKSNDIEKVKSQILEIERMLKIVDNIQTSYEKMGMDQIIYKLGKFYKGNLQKVNEEIYKCIESIDKMEISVTPKDFDYSMYVKDYMTTFFHEADKGNLNSAVIKDEFERIYWKCPEIIVHIELNLRSIFLKKQNLIDKYYEKEKNNLLTTLNSNPEQLFTKYEEYSKDLINKQTTDEAIIIDNFLEGRYIVKNYTDEKIKENYEKIFTLDTLKNVDNDEVQENIIKFIYNLYEYKNYEKFKYIFLDVKNKYLDREKHKNEYNTIKKEILSKEKKLKSLNKKINKVSIFGNKKEKEEKQSVEYNKLLLLIKEDYKKLDMAEIYSKINECLNDTSTIYDALKFAYSFRNYLTKCIIDNNKDIEENAIDIIIKDLDEFLKNPYNIITKNILITEEKDIPIIICDRYRLMNFNVVKDDINIGNIDNLISILESIEVKHNMQKKDIKIEDMNFICEFKKMLRKN